MAVFRWGEWAEAVMRMIVEVKPGENLLILADTWTDMETAEAVLMAGINAKANAQLLVIPRVPRSDTGELNPSTAGAIQGANVVVGLCETPYARKAATRKALEKGTRAAGTVPRGDEEWVLESILDVDYPRMIEMGEKIRELWEKTEVCRVTSALGTDVSFRLKGRPCNPCDGRAISPGQVGYFPGGTPSIAPIEETINGSIVVNGFITTGLVSEPVTARLENGVVTAIEGGEDASAWRSMLESASDPKTFHLCHFNVGINPHARVGISMNQEEKVVGVVTFGFGHQDASYQGAIGQDVKMHTDVTLRSATIYLDGVVMCENRKFNPDLGLSGRAGTLPQVHLHREQ
jgi:leucyl aminopeptidase (aminopeptidase T)